MKKITLLFVSILFLSSCSIPNALKNKISNLTQNEISALKQHGEVMILPLMRSIGLPDDNNPTRALDDLENWEIKNFVLLSAMYIGEPNYIYKDSIIYENRAINSYIFPLTNIQKMVYQVFGIADWDGLRNINIDWNESDESYETGLEFEIGGIIETKDISSTYDINNNQLEVSFSMSYYGVEINGDPDWSPFEQYLVTFKVLSQDGENYLRFVSVEKEIN